jgi:hypothetical protein
MERKIDDDLKRGCAMRSGVVAVTVVLLCSFVSLAFAQQLAPNPAIGMGQFSGGVLKLHRLAGQMNRCWAMAPENWYISATTPEGNVMELATRDGAAHAGYSITGVSSVLRRHPSNQWSSPEAFIHMALSMGGQERIQYGQAQQDQFGYIIQPFQKATTGVVVYKVFPVPVDPGGFTVILREASARSDLWSVYGPVAMATGMSIRCRVALSPQRERTPGPGKGSEEDRHESTYNVQLGMEYAHDPKTGENYWVSPSTDVRNGPQGPGYYKSVGNSLIKLDPGTAP